MSKHTPGPWIISQDDEFLHVYDVMTPTGYYVASTHDGVEGKCNSEANARLIAAAPDLLEALQMVSEYIRTMKQDGHQYVVAIDAAIAKATGND